MTLGLFTTTRRRCLSPTGQPGAWHGGAQPTFAAMREAVRMAHGKDLDGWKAVTGAWRELMKDGWQLQSERDWE